MKKALGCLFSEQKFLFCISYSVTQNLQGGITMIQKCSTGANNCTNPCDDDIFCIDTNRIYDSSRAQDCLDSLRVALPPGVAEKLRCCSNLKIKDVKVIWAQITTDEVPFNCGYFQINVRYYFYVCFGCCCDNCPVDFEGLAIAEKCVVLYGGEGNVSIFSSNITDEVCPSTCLSSVVAGTNRPKVVVEIASPVALNICLTENTCPVPFPNEYNAIPDSILALFENGLDTSSNACVSLYVSIGIFALIRIERPTQLIVPACDFCIPDADKSPVSQCDPCSLFCSTPFPISEFYPSACSNQND